MMPTISISPNKIIRVLIYLVVFFILAHIFVGLIENIIGHNRYPGTETFVRLFNLDAEANISTWFAASILLLCSVLIAVIAIGKKQDNDRFLRHWVALSIIFIGLSIDEAAAVHESLINPLRLAFNARGFLYFTWVIPGFIFVVIFVLVYLRFLIDLPSKTKHLFILAGFTFIVGSIGIELIGGYHDDLYGRQDMIWVVITCIEESLEMVGIVIFVYALMSYINSYKNEFQLRISKHV